MACAAGADIGLGPFRDSRLRHGGVCNTDAASARALPTSVAPSLWFRNRFAAREGYVDGFYREPSGVCVTL